MIASLPPGLCPELWVGGIKIPVYPLAMAAAIISGCALFVWNTRQERSSGVGGGLVLSALVGGALGAKLLVVVPYLIRHWDLSHLYKAVLSGRSIVGGLLGGWLGVWLYKKARGLRGRFGNPLAPSLALGLAVGRVGCLCSGCCSGRETTAIWGLALGDGVMRHPVQLMEILFALVMLVITQYRFRSDPPGRTLSLFFGAYFVFRFLEEFLREPTVPPVYGLTMYQWVCLAGLAGVMVKEVRYGSANA